MNLSSFMGILLEYFIKELTLHNIDDNYERNRFLYIIEDCYAHPLTIYEIERTITHVLEKNKIDSTEIEEFRYEIPEAFVQFVKTFDIKLKNKLQLIRVRDWTLDYPARFLPYNNDPKKLIAQILLNFDHNNHIIYDNIPSSISDRYRLNTIVKNKHLLQLLMLNKDENTYSQISNTGEIRIVNNYEYYNINFYHLYAIDLQKIVNSIVQDYLYIFCSGITNNTSDIVNEYLGLCYRMTYISEEERCGKLNNISRVVY